MVALSAVAIAVLTGCTGPVAPPARTTSGPSAVRKASQPPNVTYQPCTAADLTGHLGVMGMGTGNVTRNLVFTNTSGQACTLTSGPSKITGVRRDGHRVRLVTGAVSGVSLGYGLVGPANLRPGQSAQAVLHTTDMCQKAIAGQRVNFSALEIGIAHSGELRIGFPPNQPYNAICGVWVSTYGVRKHK